MSGCYLGLPRGLRGVEGTLFPQPLVRRYDGRPVRLDDALGTGWSVIGIGIDPREAIRDPAVWESIGASFTTVFPAGTRPQGEIGDGRRKAGRVDLEDTANDLTRWLRRAGVRTGSVVVLRPDKYVFGIAKGDPTALTRAPVVLVAGCSIDRQRSWPGTVGSGSRLLAGFDQGRTRSRNAISVSTFSVVITWPVSGATASSP